MKERPILFSAPMVRAILYGSKTQTRRAVKGFEIQGPSKLGHYDWFKNGKWEGAHKTSMDFSNSSAADNCPYGKVGERLWVRENFGKLFNDGDDEPIFYKADYSQDELQTQYLPKWKPSIHMPRRASRITLEITSVRVERLQDIHSADALAEGIDNLSDELHVDYGIIGIVRAQHPVRAYQLLWESINGEESWAANPWVWVIEFKVIK